MPRVALGQLVFDSKVNNTDKPLHNVVVKLVDDDLGPDKTLGRAVTDAEGRFRVEYDPESAGCVDVPDLKIEVFVPDVRYNKKTGKPVVGDVPLGGYTPQVFNNVATTEFDCGTLRVPYWEYAATSTSYTPRVLSTDHELVQEQRVGRAVDSLRAVTTTALHIFDLPDNKTKQMDAKIPKSSRGDEYLADIALNGFNPCEPRKTPEGGYEVGFTWDGLMQDGAHFAPDTTAVFSSPDFKLESITVTKRTGYFTQSPTPTKSQPVTYKPTDEETWDRVKRLWRVNYFLFGEVLTHLSCTHYNVEQYLIPLYRNVRLNPIGLILFPHLHGTVAINVGADDILTGGTGLVLSTSACTANSVAVMARRGFAACNWYNWQPRESVCENHRFAAAQKEFWNVLEEHVGKFVEGNKLEIEKHWNEVKMFSDELVAHSVPYVAQCEEGVDLNEVNKAEYPHPEIDGLPVAVSPITTDSQLTDDNRKENLNRLTQMCKYLIHFATFKHSWVNDTQYDMGGDPDFATLGVNWDLTDLAKDAGNAVSDSDKAKHVLTTWILTQLQYGYLTKDEERDVPPTLKDLLGKKRGAFEGHGVNIDEIRSCINT